MKQSLKEERGGGGGKGVLNRTCAQPYNHNLDGQQETLFCSNSVLFPSKVLNTSSKM